MLEIRRIIYWNYVEFTILKIGIKSNAIFFLSAKNWKSVEFSLFHLVSMNNDQKNSFCFVLALQQVPYCCYLR